MKLNDAAQDIATRLAEADAQAHELNIHRALVAVLVDKLGGSVKVTQAEMQVVGLMPPCRYGADVETGDVTISHGVIVGPDDG